MKKINENTKVTLTFEQLKKLIKEERAGQDETENNLPDWEQKLVDKACSTDAQPTGCDCMGRPVSVGDWVVFINRGSTFKSLHLGKVLAVKKTIVVKLFIPQSTGYFGQNETTRMSRPSECVFKIDNPEAFAATL